MKIYETSVRKPISTALIFVAVIVFGLFSLNNLAIDQLPEMDLPAISVVTTYQGANAEDVENNITRRIEDGLNTVSNLKEITSKSSDGVSLVSLEFEWGTNLDEASNDIRDALGRLTDFMPDDAEEPILFRFNSSMMPIMSFAITAEESYPALNKILEEQFSNRLSRIDGVGSVSIMGAPVREIQVNVDPVKLEAYGLSVEQIGGIIAQENINTSGGTLDIGNHTYNIKADGEFNSSDDLKTILISNLGGQEVYLQDIAEIKDTLEEETLDERLNGQKGVRVMIQKQSGANTVKIVEKVKKMLPEIERNLPSDVTVHVLGDSSKNIKDSIDTLTDTVMFAFLFVILVVLFFLGRWRATLIICLTIPISLVVSFIYLQLTGGTLNIISLSSLSIAIGMVVDDAIVVLENITTHIERGSKPREAAIYGTNEVWLSVIATTLVVVAVFLPLTMVEGMAGVMFKQLGWIVSLVVTTSTIAAISLTPMLSAKLLRIENNQHTYKGLSIVYKPIDRFLGWLDRAYERVLRWALRHKKVVFFAPMLLLVFGLWLFATKIPTEFMPSSDGDQMSATITLDQNLSVGYTSAVARRIDSIVYAKYPEVILLSTSAGSSSTSNVFAAMSTTGSNIINYTFRLTDPQDRERTVFEIADEFRADLATIPEIKRSTVSGGGGMMGGGSSVQVQIFGHDIERTNQIAADLVEQFSRLEGARDVRVSRDDMRPEYNVEFDRNRLAYYGLNSSTVATAIRNRINGMTASIYREDGEEYYIKVRYNKEDRLSLEDVENILVYNQRGQGVRVRDIGKVTEVYAPPTIERQNRQRLVTVTVALGNNVPLGEMVGRVNGVLATYPLPEDVYTTIGGDFEDQQESFADIGMLLVLIVLLVYIVMATQFESFIMPFIIMFTILYALPGSAIALWITNTPLSLMALIAIVMLVGIVVKNGIVMVDFTNLLRERGVGMYDAVLQAGKSRLRPVLMTSLTTVLGMLPMALGLGNGAELWQPMGITIIGGLTFSLVLTLVAVPILYYVFMGRSEKAAARRKARQQRRYEEKMKALAENNNNQ
ncbi:MAG: efflux RND transporter permease subunit [Tidjanibacter sp.]|nr:efflux RND transporter permease subunit [Tidjanibacter sp.]MBR3682830.1 efflux RND transporter permease subunit [Tidjanibacter sp.]